jgi:transcriptional regulator with XRE-family HTH domain
MDVATLFRRRLRKLILAKYRSLDRFYLETDFSKGHLSEILRGKGSPSVNTLIKLADALDVEACDFFVLLIRSDGIATWPRTEPKATGSSGRHTGV